ncbi:transglycosylase family protein [Rhodococcus sp. IEGM 1406]|uniref:transglycosylase family protein n=1 Tax=Rhodococcus sp. IEGM 1406 TaxID=3047083 RepID=UPI0024B826E8|nr:transglycosylase family protein [Rhodococcus sp. IEGM 1406]MDI9907975.1 transglycosylase family protein [Rhodococcus sp. IEGM 1406]
MVSKESNRDERERRLDQSVDEIAQLVDQIREFIVPDVSAIPDDSSDPGYPNLPPSMVDEILRIEHRELASLRGEPVRPIGDPKKLKPDEKALVDAHRIKAQPVSSRNPEEVSSVLHDVRKEWPHIGHKGVAEDATDGSESNRPDASGIPNSGKVLNKAGRIRPREDLAVGADSSASAIKGVNDGIMAEDRTSISKDAVGGAATAGAKAAAAKVGVDTDKVELAGDVADAAVVVGSVASGAVTTETVVSAARLTKKYSKKLKTPLIVLSAFLSVIVLAVISTLTSTAINTAVGAAYATANKDCLPSMSDTEVTLVSSGADSSLQVLQSSASADIGSVGEPTIGDWEAIAECESSGNWSANTGNGYMGGLQFDQSTWDSVNGGQYAPSPDRATKAQQINVALDIWRTRGWSPWGCAATLGYVGGPEGWTNAKGDQFGPTTEKATPSAGQDADRNLPETTASLPIDYNKIDVDKQNGVTDTAQPNAPPAPADDANYIDRDDALTSLATADIVLDKEQIGIARTIIGVVDESGLGDKAAVVTLATALQESTLRNLDYGDRDSQGLYQQRPSMGWGTLEQIKDPVLATKAFLGTSDHSNNAGLKDVAGWENMTLTDAAQAVQRSGFPEAYAKWENSAKQIVESLTGKSGGSSSSISSQPCSDASHLSQGDCITAMTAISGVVADSTFRGMKPDTALVTKTVTKEFGSHTYYGYRDPDGYNEHYSGVAVDIMIEPVVGNDIPKSPEDPEGLEYGDSLALYLQNNAKQLGIEYLIWKQRIWMSSAPVEGWDPMEDRGGTTANHMDHIHVNTFGNSATGAAGVAGQTCTKSETVGAAFVANLEGLAPPARPDEYTLSDFFGTRDGGHKGVDVASNGAKPIELFTMGNGTVTEVVTGCAPMTQDNSCGGGWGNHLVIDLGNGVGLRYAHMSEISVTQNQQVTAGQPIGKMGNSGWSEGVHLHLEQLDMNNGRAQVNPAELMKKAGAWANGQQAQ